MQINYQLILIYTDPIDMYSWNTHVTFIFNNFEMPCFENASFSALHELNPWSSLSINDANIISNLIYVYKISKRNIHSQTDGV